MMRLTALISVLAAAAEDSGCVGSCDAEATAMIQLKHRTSQPDKEPLASLLDSFLQEPVQALLERANSPTEPKQQELLQRLVDLPLEHRDALLELAESSPEAEKLYSTLTQDARERLLLLARSESLDEAVSAKKTNSTVSAVFETPEQSPITATDHSRMSRLEEEVNQIIGQKLREGFTCGDTEFPARDVEQDWTECRLWWASKLHSEDMAKRQYVNDNTLGTNEHFKKRVKRTAWGMLAQREVTSVFTQPPDSAEEIVDAMLNISHAHCKHFFNKRNDIVGAANVECSETPRPGAVVPDSGRCAFQSYWTILFSDPGQKRKMGVDRSCYNGQ